MSGVFGELTTGHSVVYLPKGLNVRLINPEQNSIQNTLSQSNSKSDASVIPYRAGIKQPLSWSRWIATMRINRKRFSERHVGFERFPLFWG